MSTKRYLADTNILLRFLTGEPVAQAEAVRQLFDRAAKDEVVIEISALIVAEAYYTLTSFYEVDRKETASKLLILVTLRGIKLRESRQVINTLERLQTTNVGFADAFLAAGAAQEGLEVVSFDRDLDKFKDITRFDPVNPKKSAH